MKEVILLCVMICFFNLMLTCEIWKKVKGRK